MRRYILAGILLSLSAVVLAYENVLKKGLPESYTVKKGDTLWDISNIFLDSPWKWPEIWHSNPQIHNPHLIFPGDVVSLVYIDGQPKLMVSDRGYAGRTIKLNPKIRTGPSENAIPAIPLSAIASYLQRNRVFDSESEVSAAPLVVASKGHRTTTSAGGKVYGRGDFSDGLRKYDVFRQGQIIKDPESGEILGVIGLEVGAVDVSEVTNGTASLIVRESRIEIRPGDLLVKEEPDPLANSFYPKAPDSLIEARLTANLTGAIHMSRYDTVVINKGSRESLKQGDLLAIYKPSEQIQDKLFKKVVSAPPERIGFVMVYRPFEKMSYGIVLSAKQSVEVGDILKSPVF